MSSYYGTEAIVLSSRPVGEADSMLTLYTEQLGKVEVLAKGVRLAKSKLRGHITAFARARVLLARGKEYWRLLDAEVHPRDNGSGKLGYVKEYADFVSRLVVAPEPDEHVWDVLRDFPAIESRSKLYTMQARLLKALGFLPERHELKRFFNMSVVSFLSGKEASLILEEEENAKNFEHGIAKLLTETHMA